MINRLRKLKFKSAPTLNNFVKKIDDLKQIKEYVAFLDKEPKRTDFISFDNEGFSLNDNNPIFKGWEACEDASSETIKVAKKGENRIYFDTADGVIIANQTNLSDNVRYNDLFIFFESNLKLS